MMNNTFLQVQLIVVGLLASVGLLTLGRWLRTNEFRIWSSAWLAWSGGATCLSLVPMFPELIGLILFCHTLLMAFFSFYLCRGCLLNLTLVDVQSIAIRRTGWIVFAIVLFLSIFIIVIRWLYLPHQL